jgi:hypothetical protein
MRKIYIGLLTIIMLGLVLSSSVTAEQKDECLEKLKRLGMMCQLYAEDHDGKMPLALSDLYYEAYITDLDDFICTDKQDELADRLEIDIKTSYALSKQSQSPGEGPLVQGRSDEAAAVDGLLAYYSDGSVRLTTPAGTTTVVSQPDGEKKPVQPDVTAPSKPKPAVNQKGEPDQKSPVQRKQDLQAMQKKEITQKSPGILRPRKVTQKKYTKIIAGMAKQETKSSDSGSTGDIFIGTWIVQTEPEATGGYTIVVKKQDNNYLIQGFSGLKFKEVAIKDNTLTAIGSSSSERFGIGYDVIKLKVTRDGGSLEGTRITEYEDYPGKGQTIVIKAVKQ